MFVAIVYNPVKVSTHWIYPSGLDFFEIRTHMIICNCIGGDVDDNGGDHCHQFHYHQPEYTT